MPYIQHCLLHLELRAPYSPTVVTKLAGSHAPRGQDSGAAFTWQPAAIVRRWCALLNAGHCQAGGVQDTHRLLLAVPHPLHPDCHCCEAQCARLQCSTTEDEHGHGEVPTSLVFWCSAWHGATRNNTALLFLQGPGKLGKFSLLLQIEVQQSVDRALPQGMARQHGYW